MAVGSSNDASAAAERAPAHTPTKAALAAWIGSALEYYDFFVYGTAAALVFPKIFFPSTDPKASTIASLATFGVAYLARPIGSFILGHLGDKYGRKKVLLSTVVLMGASTFLVGCLPTYQSAGLLAPALLVALRLLQGLSAAGEQAGANSMSLEHAPPHRRCYFTSFTLSGTQGGLILATIVFMPLSSMAESRLLSWGWRVPFFLSAIVVFVGLWIRRSLEETPVFKEQLREKKAPKLPVAELFKQAPGSVVRIVFAALISVVSTIFALYSLSYAVNTVHIAKNTMLALVVMANVIALVAIPAWATLADRIGRKPVFVFGALGCAALIWPYLWAVSKSNVPAIFGIGLLLSGIVYSASNGVWPALYGEQFDTRVRLSGTAIGTQIGFMLGGFAPAIASALLKPGPGGWIPVAIFTSVVAVISAISATTARETFDVPMEQLGAKRAAENPR